MKLIEKQNETGMEKKIQKRKQIIICNSNKILCIKTCNEWDNGNLGFNYITLITLHILS